MRRKMTLSLMMTLSMLLSLVGFATTAQGQQLKPIADTGFVTLRSGQVLRITVVGTGGNDTVHFAWEQYMEQGCNGGVCRHTVASRGVTDPAMIGPDDASSFDVSGNANGDGVRVQVYSKHSEDSAQVRVRALIIDAVTGQIVCNLTANLNNEWQ